MRRPLSPEKSLAYPRSPAPDHDLADLDYGSLVGVVGNVSHDLLGVGTEAGLEGLDGFAKNMAHADLSRRGTRGSTCNSLVHRVIFAAGAHSGLYQRHVLVAVVHVVESRTRLVGVHHRDFDHRPTPSNELVIIQDRDGEAIGEP